MDKDRKAIIDRRAKGRAEALGKDKGKSNLLTLVKVSHLLLYTMFLAKAHFQCTPSYTFSVGRFRPKGTCVFKYKICLKL